MTAAAVTYDVVHTTRYDYSEAVLVSHHVARLSPRSLPYQTCLWHELRVEPEPAVRRNHVDYFGNGMTFFMMERAHRTLSVSAHSRVSLTPRQPPMSDAAIHWEVARDHDALPLDVIECVFESRSIPHLDDVASYARPSFPVGRPFMEAVTDLMHRIHRDFVFDPQATTVATQLHDVVRLRRGVCQDFAQLGIGCLRSMGLAARYVSGYLETLAPAGVARLTGADASHAWLSVFCPGVGWVDLDPTNDVLPTDRHITLGWGRDYGDVSPIRGVILGGGDHSLNVGVDVLRVAGA